MSDDDLRLNTLHRFRKHSPRLLLEEYSHCEVPAGCGGVVLRWVDPDAAVPAIVRWQVPAEVEWWLDGVTPSSGRVDLRPGAHVLALALTNIEQPKSGRLAGLLRRERPAALLLSIVRALGSDSERGDDVVPLLRSGEGPTWRVSAEQPPEGWTALDFDDASWTVPARAPLDDQQREAWRVRQLLDQGAEPLALPRGRAFVRVRFEAPKLELP